MVRKRTLHKMEYPLFFSVISVFSVAKCFYRDD